MIEHGQVLATREAVKSVTLSSTCHMSRSQPCVGSLHNCFQVRTTFKKDLYENNKQIAKLMGII